jgi:acylphosphatase
MNIKVWLLAGIFLSGTSVQASSDFDQTTLVAEYEQTMFRVYQELEQINFLQWLLSLGQAVENSFMVLNHDDGTITVVFSGDCLRSLKYQEPFQVMILVTAFQDPKKRVLLEARAGELEVKKKQILEAVAKLEAEGQRMMNEYPL